VKIVDANILINAVNEDGPHHHTALSWLQAALSGNEAIGFPWVVVLAFLRVSTHPTILAQPLSRSQALDTVEDWLAQRPATLVEATPRHLALLRGLLDTARHGGNLVTDAHIAALALEHGAEVVTFDRDFARFGVRHLIPT
jgi:toxin-antitoxin system PIN domain toxin